ncbi:DUF4870 domain-containing protein [Lachnoclostridium sp. Marseille-P6806]|uniref:DUF4870 domain-containing protein n=1 Tax=Lachnoclostridium sp. Marseille-P6806 TaxID=2364793 RepID=UPI0010321CBA|nr:zinc ribbon domain-containing protein [Lachnoclostridium sp. Marseille-P6806]
MKLCNQCGAPAEDDVKFCANCGAPFAAEKKETAVKDETAAEAEAAAPKTDEQPQGSAAGTSGEDAPAQDGAAEAPDGNRRAEEAKTHYEHVEGEVMSENGAPVSSNSTSFGIVAYITWIGLLIAFLAGDRNDPYLRFHLNQSLVINLFGLVGLVPVIGWICRIFVFVCWIIAIIGAAQGQKKEVPLLGSIHIL